jgi:thiamine-phosphate pyrophosphorylase
VSPVDGRSPALAAALRLIVITDRGLAAPRPLIDVVTAALAAGTPSIQLRDKRASGAGLLAMARELRALTRSFGALLFVNDRLDVALAAGADGVHLGPDDLPVAAVRAHAPEGFLVGFSTDDPDQARRAVADGADYIGCGAVYATGSKADAGPLIGLARLDEVANAVSVPVVAIGGVTPTRAAEIAATAAAGVAVIGAVMSAPEPGDAVARLLAALRHPTPR